DKNNGSGFITENSGSPVIGTSPSTSVHNRHARRIKLSDQQLESISREELLRNWRELDSYVDMLESQTSNQEAELSSLRESEERMRQQHLESSHREKVLVRRLATKEQEMQEYANQIAELKAAQAPGTAALRSALLDPAVNLLLQRLRQELLATRARLEETQNELSAWKFTPDSNTGKRLMAKCRLLYQENEELGRMINSGRLAKLEGDLALQKSFSEEVKKSQSELDEFLQDLDEDVEGMQSTIYYLQQELRKAKDTVTTLQQENTMLKNGNGSAGGESQGVGDSDVGREARPRTPPVCQNGFGLDPILLENLKEEHLMNHESANLQASSPAGRKREWERTKHDDDTSSDSGELILKLEAEEIGEEETESRDSNNAESENVGVKSKKEGTGNINSALKGSNHTGKTEQILRKRTYQSDDSSGDDSDNVPLIKKVRRDSEISLHYNEDDDDETGLTNGDATIVGGNGQ
ncbi:hypothetical protein L9F63_005210, partial [Diploptera punctata]